MFQHTDSDEAPWRVVKSYVLDRFDYDDKDQEVVGTPDPASSAHRTMFTTRTG
jgi:polyphosphate kinase